MSRRALVVSPYAPWRDGIASYALAEVRARRRAGDQVEVCSPRPSAAHHHLPLASVRGALGLARLARGFDELIVHFHPGVFFPRPTPWNRVATGLALSLAFRSGPPVRLLVHELPESWLHGGRPWAAALRLLLRSASRLEVHDAGQRERLERLLGVPVAVVEHGSSFTPQTELSRAEARASLGVAPDRVCLLCAGFLAPHKGFDRAVEAFGALVRADPDLAGRAELHLVGSARAEGSVARSDTYLRRLTELVAATPGAHLHAGYVSDERFDRWLLAADAVVLPYREIWSSSVAARAVLLGRPVIASDVGGLRAQLADVEGAVLVADDSQLRDALARALGAAPPADAPAPAEPRPVDLGDVAREIRRRAAARRGHPLTDPLDRLEHLELAPTSAARAPVALAKVVLRRLSAWQLQPVADHVNRLQDATRESLGSCAHRDEAPAGGAR